jgi:hypothetical protein
LRSTVTSSGHNIYLRSLLQQIFIYVLLHLPLLSPPSPLFSHPPLLRMDPLPEPALPPSTRTYGGNAAFHNFYNDYTHISDPNLRRRLALSEVDKIPFGWYVLLTSQPAWSASRAPGGTPRHPSS